MFSNAPAGGHARPRLFRLLAAVIALAVVASACNAASGPAPQAGDGMMLGGTPDYLGGPTNIADKVKNLEKNMGRKADVVRVWHGIDSKFPVPGEVTLRDQGKALLLTVRSDRENRSRIPWRDIANAQPGSNHHNLLVSWAQRVKNYGGKVYINFNHEPEIVKHQSFGTSEEYKAAFRKFVQVFRSQNVNNVEFVWIMTSYAFRVNSSDRRAAAKWYPGDAYVDHIAADPYNWANCRGGNNDPWTELSDLIEPFRQFGAQHPDKGLILAEFGSVEDPNNPNRKAQWFANARKMFKQPQYSQFIMAVYYDQREPNIPNCKWQLDSSNQSRSAFQAMARDPFFNASAPTARPPAPQPTSPPATSSPAPPATASTPASTRPSTGYGSGGGSNGVRPPAACWATKTGAKTFRVTWTPSDRDNAVRYVVRRSRNGSAHHWTARAGAGERHKVDRVSNNATYRYTVEAHTANGTISSRTTCGGGGQAG